MQPSKPHIDGDPLPDTPPLVSGGYASGVDSRFEKTHFALWGRQAAQTKNEIKQMVADYQPAYLLVLLGFNDLGVSVSPRLSLILKRTDIIAFLFTNSKANSTAKWFITGPDGTLASIKSIVDNARAANPNINIIIGDVVQRSAIGFRADLPIITNEYNALLRNSIPKWNTKTSPIAMAYIREHFIYGVLVKTYLIVFVGDIYSCETQACPSGHDGLHPNAYGEYQIARAFSLALFYGFGIGTSTLSIPANVPSRQNPVCV